MRLLRLQVRAHGFRGQGLRSLLRRTTFALIALPVLYLIAALAGAVIPASGESGGGRHEILLVHGPIHYDFLLPLDAQTRAAFGFLGDSGFDIGHPGALWILVGWGGREFYTTTPTYREVSFRAVWRSVLGDASVMRVDLVGELNPDLEKRALHLDDAGYARLLEAIRGSFAAGVPIEGYGAYDMFFPAKGRFDLAHTCNDWVGRMIREAGLRFGVWTPLPAAVSLSWWMYQSF